MRYDDESPSQPDELRREDERRFHERFPPEYDPEPVEPAGGGKPGDYAVCIERTVRDGVEVLVYQQRKP